MLAEQVQRRFFRHEPVYLNQFKMFYKIHDAWAMHERYAREHGVEYDYVVRVRPDRDIDTLGFEEIYRRIVEHHVVGGHSVVDEGFDDGFGIGRPPAMERYCGIWLLLCEAGTHRYLPTIRKDGPG